MTSPACATGIASGIISGMADNTAPPKPDKVHENRVRRAAARQGLRLEKSPLRDPFALGYGTYRLRTEGGGNLVAGREDRGRDYGLQLDAVEAWLRGDRPTT